jgi:hypothetical protein
MSSYKTDQQRLQHRGREFHFVSYEGRGADPAKNIEAVPPTWFLMAGGKRFPVMPQVAGLEVGQLHQKLIDWLDENMPALGLMPRPPAGPRPKPRRAR